MTGHYNPAGDKQEMIALIRAAVELTRGAVKRRLACKSSIAW
jgi:hypothetical protein